MTGDARDAAGPRRFSVQPPGVPRAGSAGALGTLALAHLLDQDDAAAPRGAARRPTSEAAGAACRSQGPGEVGDLPVPARRAEPDGPVRPQARADEVPRQAVPRQARDPLRHAGGQRCWPRRSSSARTGSRASELSASCLPHTAGIVDDITLVRSMTTESVDHEAALRLIHTGKILAGRPTWGSWVVYAPGHREPEPAGLRRPVRPRRPAGRRRAQLVERLAAGGLPGDAVPLRRDAGAQPRDARGASRPRPATASSGFLDELNRAHLGRHPGDTELEARIANFEIAARMQTAVPEALDLSSETEATRRLYGLDNPASREYGTRCLLARRLVERGVRFVQLFLSGQPWDTHSKNAETLEVALRPDRPAQRGPGPGPQAARAARLDDRALDGRVRPAAGLAGDRRPRPQPPRLLALAGRRRLQAGLRPRRDRRLRLRRRSRTSSRSTTSRPRCSTPWASTTASSPTPTRAATTA